MNTRLAPICHPHDPSEVRLHLGAESSDLHILPLSLVVATPSSAEMPATKGRKLATKHTAHSNSCFLFAVLIKRRLWVRSTGLSLRIRPEASPGRQ